MGNTDLDQLFPLKSQTPNISYWFVDQIVQNYLQLQNSFENNGNVCPQPPTIKFFSLPNRSNARWNSKAILAILSVILIPNIRSSQLEQDCDFILKWGDLWFASQKQKHLLL